MDALLNRPPAILVLADGTCFEGVAIGAEGRATGEVVFNTGMTGYQEVLTDPSYRGQMVTFTSPHIGNYGVNAEDGESTQIHASAVVVRDLSRRVSNHRATASFEEWLIENDVVGIAEVDTRSLTRHLREQGVTMGIIVHGATGKDVSAAQTVLASEQEYGSRDLVGEVAQQVPLRVTTATDDVWSDELILEACELESPGENMHVVVIDFGVKFSILRHLLQRGVTVTLVPRDIDDEALAALGPDGILWSNGPGDPAQLTKWLPRVHDVSLQYPSMGICLGHQLLASAFGAETYKLPYGHRGPNQPVRDLGDETVAITSQNHGYSVISESIPDVLEVTQMNLNDNTVAGFRHRHHAIMAVQYHPEAGPGPRDAVNCFDKFIESIRADSAA